MRTATCRCGALIDNTGRGPRCAQTVCDPCQRETDLANLRRRADAKITPAVRAAVIARDGMRCRYCGVGVIRRPTRYGNPLAIELDHVEPLSLGGTSTVENLVVSCERCNRGKRVRRITPRPLEASHV